MGRIMRSTSTRAETAEANRVAVRALRSTGDGQQTQWATTWHKEAKHDLRARERFRIKEQAGGYGAPVNKVLNPGTFRLLLGLMIADLFVFTLIAHATISVEPVPEWAAMIFLTVFAIASLAGACRFVGEDPRTQPSMPIVASKPSAKQHVKFVNPLDMDMDMGTEMDTKED
jgi:hypothetical protein